MQKGRAGRRLRRRLSAPLLVLGTACSQRGRSPSTLAPGGAAERVVTPLWWWMLAVATAVFVFVVVMGAWGVVRGRRTREEDIRRVVPWGDTFILIAGLGVTGAILVGFFLFSLHGMATLADEGSRTSLTITVPGHDWWWEAGYPNGAVTANEIHIPTGRRVQLNLRTADVIHSFWVPELAPKIDLIPGRDNAMWLEADRPGRYRGQCAEYCGLQHAHMIVYVIADLPSDFDRWERAMAAPAATPADALAARGEQLLLANTCAGCHSIRGTTASGTLGPDLTHLASRGTIASGTLPFTPEALLRWITDPQRDKPGATMPPTTLTPDEARAIVAYLMSLQ